MTASLVASLIGIAVLDSLNPSLFVAQAYLLTTPRPIGRVLSYIAGVLVANFGGGVLLLGGVRTLITDLLHNLGSTTLYGLQFALGLAILVFGLWFGASNGAGDVQQPRSLRPIHAFTLGAAVMVNELTTALPYFVALEQIAQAQQGVVANILALLLYNAVFGAPLVALLVWFVAYRERFAAQIERVTQAVQRWTPPMITYGSLVFGGLLMLNAAVFLMRGAALFT